MTESKGALIHGHSCLCFISLNQGICDCDVVPHEYANADPNPVIDEMRLLDVLDSLDHLRAEIDAAFDAVESHLRYLCC